MNSNLARAAQALPWLLLGTLFYPVFFILYKSRWDYIDYTHAFFVLPTSLFLVWSKRADLQQAAGHRKGVRAAEIAWLTTAGLFLTAFTFAYKQDYLFLQTLFLIPIAAGLSGFLYGTRALKMLSFPILYLLFLVPPPLGVLDSLTLPMRKGVSAATEILLKTTGYPITREGLLLTIGGREVYLGEACSGFRSLITLGCLGLAYIYFSKAGARRKWLMAASIVPLALAGNFLRVVAVVLVTHYFGVNKGQEFFHDFSGFVMFLILVAGLLAVERGGKRAS